MLKAFLCFITTIVLSVQRCSGYTQAVVPNDFMLCRKVPDIFGSAEDDDEDDDDDNDDDDVEVGKPGPVGINGPTGRQGLPGPRGEPDYTEVQEIINKQSTILAARLDKMEKELAYLKANPPTISGSIYTRPTESPEQLINNRRCMSKFLAPISIGTRCYAIHGSEGLSLTYDYAQSNCSKNGGRLANPDSRALYHKLYDFADKTFHNLVRAWVGLKYEDDKLMHSDNGNSTFMKWLSYYPKKGKSYSFYAEYKYVIMYIDTSSFIIGLQNVPSRRKYSHAICEYDLDGPLPTPTSLISTTTEDPDDYYEY